MPIMYDAALNSLYNLYNDVVAVYDRGYIFIDLGRVGSVA